MSRFVKIAALAALFVVSAPNALAEKPVSNSTAVTYADLDLSAPAGVQTLLKRIDAASRKVCGKRPMQVRYGQLASYLDCRETAMNGAVEKINNPVVTFAWQGEAGTAMRVAIR